MLGNKMAYAKKKKIYQIYISVAKFLNDWALVD